MKTILGTDGSPFAQIAECILARLPRVREGEVIVCSVIPTPAAEFATLDPLMATTGGEEMQAVFDAQAQSARTLVGETVERLTAQGIKARAELRDGDPSAELIGLAEAEHADLVAVGSRGLGGLEGFLLGSTAKALVANAPCSVLIGHAFGGDRDGHASLARLDGTSTLSVGVGADGSDGSQAAIDRIVEQGAGAFHRAYALCAEPLAVLPPEIDPASIGEVTRVDRERVLEIAKRADRELEHSAPTTKGVVKFGRPHEVLLELAKELDLDLLVVGASRHGAIERFLIGSVSMAVVSHANCPVWVVRPRA